MFDLEIAGWVSDIVSRMPVSEVRDCRIEDETYRSNVSGIDDAGVTIIVYCSIFTLLSDWRPTHRSRGNSVEFPKKKALEDEKSSGASKHITEKLRIHSIIVVHGK